MKTLVVDDEVVTVKMLKRLFSRFGQCVSATNGYDALEFVKIAYDEGEPFDILIMDVVMPGLNGFETYSAIRDLEFSLGIEKDSQTKIIIMTGLGISREIFELHKTSCMAYLYKPIEVSELMQVLQKNNILPQASQATQEPQAEPSLPVD
ncbi:MAG: response regulator [Nitrospirae bacterium]|nr:response regulator [Nitrospirota bacterium]